MRYDLVYICSCTRQPSTLPAETNDNIWGRHHIRGTPHLVYDKSLQYAQNHCMNLSLWNSHRTSPVRITDADSLCHLYP